MIIKELKSLSELSQITIDEQEFKFFLEMFKHLEKMVIESSLTTTIEQISPMDRILINQLTLDEIRDLQLKHLVFKLSKCEVSSNALMSHDGKFVLLR